jgi:hypothetical protein
MWEEDMKNVCFINGSLRGKRAASLAFLQDVNRQLAEKEFKKTFIKVRAKVKDDYPEDTLKNLAVADVIVFVFPLYTYGLPGSLMRLLEEYYSYIKTGKEYNKDAKVYVIVNCAFPRPEATTGEAVRVIKIFCRRFSLNWRFALCIGTGPVVAFTKKVPFLYPKLNRAYREIAADIRCDENAAKSDYFIRPIIPGSIIAMIKRHYENKGQMIERKKNKPVQIDVYKTTSLTSN